MKSEKQSKRLRRPSPHDEREEMVSRGDVLGLMQHLERQGIDYIGLSPGIQLHRCIQQRASDDVEALADDAFTLTLELAVYLLARARFLVTHAIERHDNHGKPMGSLPPDIERMIERTEQISRFISQLTRDRARDRHVHRLASARDKDQKSSSGNGRADRATSSINGQSGTNGHAGLSSLRLGELL